MNGQKLPMSTGQHFIGYAYPTSELASKAGHGSQGCYYYTVDPDYEQLRPFQSFKDALAHAKDRGTSPARWSMDHESNAHLLQQEVLA